VGNLVFAIDCKRGSVVAIDDGPPIPLPPESGNYDVGSVGPLRTDLRPLEITQSEGPSFTVTGNVIDWQRWRLQAHIDPFEGLVISDISYLDGGAAGRSCTGPASARWSCPTATPATTSTSATSFDAGEYSLGKTVGSLSLGCDCLGEIRYLDAVVADESGSPTTITNAICCTKRTTESSGSTELPLRQRARGPPVPPPGRLGHPHHRQLRVRLLLVLLPRRNHPVRGQADRNRADPRDRPGTTPEFGALVAPQLDAPNHQHLFNMRLDFEVDGPNNTVLEVDAVGRPPSAPATSTATPSSPAGPRSPTNATHAECATRRRPRTWKVINPNVRNRFGEPVGYKLVPFVGPTLLAAPESDLATRAEFARHHLWVTGTDPAEMHAAATIRTSIPATGSQLGKQERDLVQRGHRRLAHLRHLAPATPRGLADHACEYVGFSLKPVVLDRTRRWTCRRRLRTKPRAVPSRTEVTMVLPPMRHIGRRANVRSRCQWRCMSERSYGESAVPLKADPDIVLSTVRTGMRRTLCWCWLRWRTRSCWRCCR